MVESSGLCCPDVGAASGTGVMTAGVEWARMRWAWVGLCLAAALLAFGGCGELDGATPQLRVANVGRHPILKLTVLFPGEQIPFGDIPGGGTSSYVEVPRGVYRYAAYRLEVDGDLVTQPVVDWVGETPMAGRMFTYSVEVDPARSRFEIVSLVGVTRDD